MKIKFLLAAMLFACLSVLPTFAQCTQTLPYAENFDNMTSFSSCFKTMNAQLSTTYAVSSPKAVKLTPGSEGAYIVFPDVAANANAIECCFKIRTSSDSANYYVGIVSDTSDILSYFMPVYSGTVHGTTWEDVEINTSSASVATAPTFLCIYVMDGYSGSVYVDNIDFHDLPSCVRPNGIAVTSSGMNDVTFGWTAGGSETQWSISYTIQQSGTTVANNTVTTTQPSYTVNGLTPSTAYTYTVSLRAICGAGDTSLVRTATGSFSTSCTIISTFPYTEDFESDFTSCHRLFNGCLYNECVATLSRTTSKKHGGNYSLKGPEANSYDDFPALALPQMNFTDPNGYTVKFWMYRDNSSYCTGHWANEGFRIYSSSRNDNMTDTTFLGFISCSKSVAPVETSTGWYQYSFEIPATVTGLNYIIIAYDCEYGRDGYIDDITVEVTAGCRGLTATAENVASTTADIVAGDATATSWQVLYWENSATNTPVLVTATSARQTITGLTPNTQYNYYVRRICSATDTSDWSSVQTFRTTEVADTLPFITGFETTDDNNWNITSQYYNAFVIGNDANAVYAGQQALYVSSNGSTYGYASSGDCQAFASRTFHFDETEYNISFKYKCTGGEISSDNISIYDFGRAFLVPSTVTLNGGNSWMSYASYDGNWPSGMIALDPEAHPYISKETGDANGWNTMSRDLNMIGRSGDYKIVFMWNNDGGATQYPLAIDELAITYITCPRPTAIVSQLTSNSANLAVSGAASFRVLVSTQPINIYGTPTADVMDTVITSEVDITGLTANTTYYYTVRGFCQNGDTSEWRNLMTFTTECLSNIPYTESFEQASVLDCWSQSEGNALTRSNNRAHQGLRSLHIDNVMAISPELDVDSMAYYTLTGWVYSEAADELYVGVIVDPTDGSTGDPAIVTVNIPANTWTEFTAPFTLLSDPEYVDYAEARHFTLSMAAGTAFNVDQLHLGIPTVCGRPTNPVITDTVHNGFQMTWSDSIANQWAVRVTEDSVGTVHNYIVNTQYIDITDLTEQTTYTVEVAAVCAVGDTSLYTSCGVVRTPVYVPTCPDPAAAATVDATTSSTMTVTANGNYMSYEFAYATTNSTGAFVGIIPSATNRTVITGLSANTTYYVCFRGVCEPGDTSRWSAMASGTTTYNDFFMPQNVHVVGVADTTTTIAWGGCPDAHKYLYELVNNTTGEVLTDTVVFTNLTPATTYTFRVCAVDTVTPDTTAWVSINFKTIATTATIPYFCDFETVAENDCWMFENGDQANRFMIGTATDFGTPTTALFVSGNDSTNTYVNTASTVYAYRSLNLPAGSYRYNYNWVCAGEPGWNVGTAYDYPRIFLAPASMQFTAGTVADGIGYGFNDIPANCLALDSGTHLTQALSTRYVNGAFELESDGIYNLVVFWTNDNSTMYDPTITVDSIRISQIIEGDTYYDTICNGEAYNQHGFNVPATQLYTGFNNLSRIAAGTSGNPDTLFHAIVYMRPQIAEYFYDTICAGDNYTKHGYNLVNPGTGYYPQSGLISVTGCDSSTHLYLQVIQTSSVEYRSTCKYEPFYWNGQYYSTTGTYTFSGIGAGGCPVNDTLHLTVIDGDMTYTRQICNGGSIVIGDTVITTAGTYTVRFHDYTIGCEVVHTVTVNEVSSKVVDFYDNACEGHPYIGYGYSIAVVTKDTLLSSTTTSVDQCDSTTNIHLTFVPTVSSEFDDTIPSTGVYYWGGQTLTQPGDYHHTFTTVQGCDSVVTLHLHAGEPTGVETLSDIRIDVVPNPVTVGATALVYGDFGDIRSVQIINSFGQVIDTFVPQTYPIEVSGISASGIYYIRLVTTTGDIHVQRLIVK